MGIYNKLISHGIEVKRIGNVFLIADEDKIGSFINISSWDIEDINEYLGY